jgi:hypothetical protein
MHIRNYMKVRRAQKSGNIGYIVDIQSLKWQHFRQHTGNNRQHFDASCGAALAINYQPSTYAYKSKPRNTRNIVEPQAFKVQHSPQHRRNTPQHLNDATPVLGREVRKTEDRLTAPPLACPALAPDQYCLKGSAQVRIRRTSALVSRLHSRHWRLSGNGRLLSNTAHNAYMSWLRQICRA